MLDINTQNWPASVTGSNIDAFLNHVTKTLFHVCQDIQRSFSSQFRLPLHLSMQSTLFRHVTAYGDWPG